MYVEVVGHKVDVSNDTVCLGVQEKTGIAPKGKPLELMVRRCHLLRLYARVTLILAYYSGLENCCEATVFEHMVDVTLQGVGMALSACRER